MIDKAILARTGLVLLALAAFGLSLYPERVIFAGPQPLMAETPREQKAEAQSGGREWQDSFAAIEDPLAVSGERDAYQRCLKPPSCSADSQPLAQEDRETLTIGVLLPGGPHGEDARARGRIRSAVFAALAGTGFAPEDSGRRYYFFWPPPGSPPSAAKAETREDPNNPVTPGKGPEGVNVIPFGRFEKSAALANRKRILVLWLNEDVFRGEPLLKLSALGRFLFGDAHAGGAGARFKLLGPYSSELLRDMVNELRKFAYSPPYDKAFGRLAEQGGLALLQDAEFYAYGASAADTALLGYLAPAYGTVQHYFEAAGLRMQRTTAPDSALARGIVREFKRRKVAIGAGRGDVALISDWDSYGGYSLPEAVELALGHPRPGNDKGATEGPEWVHRLSYLPGLARQFPDTGAARELQRINEQLKGIGNGLRREGRAIRAIGILGSTVSDKLLLLRVLRPRFPEALFFTANFDQAFARESALPFTQSLLISSSYGPALHTGVPGKAPAFSASDQASAFLAALLAIGDPAKDWTAPQEMRENLSDQLLVSRIFEIGRDGRVISLSGEGAPVRLAGNIAEGRSMAQPAFPENHFSRFEKNSGYVLAVGLAGMVLIFWLCFLPVLRQFVPVSLPRQWRSGALKLLPRETEAEAILRQEG